MGDGVKVFHSLSFNEDEIFATGDNGYLYYFR